MRPTILLSMVLLVGALTAVAQDAGSQGTASSSSNDTLTGCLKGSKGQYYLVEKNGHRHTLMENGQDLSSYVNHNVTVTGKASTARKAGGSSDATTLKTSPRMTTARPDSQTKRSTVGTFRRAERRSRHPLQNCGCSFMN